ncbi:hypothetical protein DFP93_11332 [Aneurinibacillus soli]|uniref:Uncharacterized protein n=1 Tax=Aneurinibacillus soli TaxID=1500254 RepID=A0A0U5B8M5_9BACL|nr:PepSY domain-containing protein [Aneurinibacillus soli]PYE60324.1 hypothetical protein DFP93_11332 [Aneurinibacillus soli]BAU27276.1 hypothetical protein CB4_01445 [Aneurinibacillus soli]
MGNILENRTIEENFFEIAQDFQSKLDIIQSSHKIEINILKENVEHLNQHLIQIQELLKKDKNKKMNISINWYKFFRTSHLYIGLSTSILMIIVCIAGLIFRHPTLFGISTTISSLNSGMFIIGNYKIDFTFLVDIMAITLLYLIGSGIGMWYYPKMLKKRKEKIKKEMKKVA